MPVNKRPSGKEKTSGKIHQSRHLQMHRRIQANVFQTSSKKLLYLESPLKRAYPPNGLTREIFHENNKTHVEKTLCAYRNMIRMVRYLQIHTFLKNSFKNILKVKFRQDYNLKKRTLFPQDFKSLTNDEIYERMINTVNFIHNATLDDPIRNNSPSDRPISKEFKILKGLIQYEMSKNISPALRGKLKCKFYTLEDYKELRKSERSWRMNTCHLRKDSQMEMLSQNVWWIDHETGLFKDDVSIDWLREIQSMPISSFAEKMVYSLIQYEKSLLLLNDEVKLLL